MFPEQLWAAHFLLFMNDWLVAGLMLIGSIAFWIASSEFLTEHQGTDSLEDESIWNRLKLVLPLLAGAFVVSTPMVVDAYGDSFSIIPHFNQRITAWNSQMTRELLTLDFTNPKIGEQTFYSISFLLSWIFNTTPLNAVKYLEVICLMLSVYFWAYLAQHSTENLALRSALTVAAVFAPFTIVFHAHTEMYALPYTYILGFIAFSKWVYNKGCKPLDLIGLAVLFILGIKLHIFCVLLFPILFMALISKIKLKNFERIKNYGHWVLLLVGTGAVVLCYVFVTDSANGTRVFTKNNLYEAVFLPIISKEGPPLDRYNLLSSAHILDYLNMFYLWGSVFWSAAIVGASGFLIRLRENSYAKGLLLSFSAFVLVFFILNPLLSMPTDWDLFFFPGLLLMPLLLEFINEIEPKLQTKLALVIGLLALLNLPLFITHLNKASLSERLTHVGYHEFKTYWKGTSSTIILANELQNPDQQANHLTESIESLRPVAVEGFDNEFAELIRSLASIKEVKADPIRRVKLLEEAYAFSPFLLSNTYDLCVEYSRSGQFRKAKPLVIELLKNQFPNPMQVTNLGIYVFLMANDTSSAIQLCREARLRWPDKTKYNKLLQALENSEIDKAIALIGSN